MDVKVVKSVPERKLMPVEKMDPSEAVLRKREHARLYYIANKERIRIRSAEFYKNNRSRVLARQRKDDYAVRKAYRFRILDQWSGFIPAQTNCQVCGAEIFFNNPDKKKSIQFDHKHENYSYKDAPKDWLKMHKRTPLTEAQWKEFDFGMLCKRCNLVLPTKERKEFVLNLVRYVFKNQPVADQKGLF